MISQYWARDSGEISSAQSSSENPMMQLSGVRTSWQTELTNANRLKVQAETIGINKSNEILDIVKGIKDNELLSSSFRAAMDKIAAQYAEVNAIADVNEKAARIQELNERAAKEAAEAAKTDSDRLISQYMADANKRAVEAQANLANAQAETEGAKKSNFEALTDTENALREGRKSLTDAQAKQALSIAGLNDVKRDSEAYSYFLRLVNAPTATTVSGLLAQIGTFVKSHTNRDLNDYQRAALSDYLEQIWSGKKP